MPDFQIPAQPPRIKLWKAKPRPQKFAVLPLRAVTDKRLGDRQLRMLALVASYANRAGITWVTQRQLGLEIGIRQQGMSQHMKKLQALGYLERIGGYKRGVKGWTWRILFEPKLSIDDAIAAAQPDPEDDPTMKPNWTPHGPQPIGDIIGELRPKLDRRRRKAVEAQPPASVEETRRHEPGEYLREYVRQVASVFGVERVPNEADVAVAARLSTAGVSMDVWRALLAESLEWHRERGRTPPAGLGYWQAAALA
jgi:hypothetical protein